MSTFTHPEIWAFASAWYQLLDIHAPLESYRPLLTSDVELVFPEATVSGFEGYAGWYSTVIDIFFDEIHTLKVADIISQTDSTCTAHVVVNWKASVWKPPAARSTRLMMDADQTWELVRSDKGLQVSKYIVNGMNYEEGSCKL
ncbi:MULTISPECIES: hypothetical protein [Aphanothece]|uniref:hypothetical protein n=1 Tax=Aphanothece TaxID=1121 RepID=UPI003984D473